MCVLGNGVWGMCSDCEKDSGKSSEFFIFICILFGFDASIYLISEVIDVMLRVFC